MYTLKKLGYDDRYVLRESDKKMGWSFNSVGWYKGEYDRHLKMEFYERVGDLDLVDGIKHNCKVALTRILGKYRGILSIRDLEGFKICRNSLDDYVLPRQYEHNAKSS